MFTIGRRYLNLPVKNGAPKRRVTYVLDGKEVRGFEMELAEAEPDFWVFSQVDEHNGRSLVITVEGENLSRDVLGSIAQDDVIKGAENVYKERYRPQFHFSSQRGWNNDPNGLLCYKGEYHLLYQHNPYGVKWGNMHWGHAVSTDLVHWQELSEALYPDHLGTCFSGSGVVDWHNTAGFQTGEEKPLICIYTSAGERFTQSLAYSNDRGRTWRKHSRNPVLEHIAGHNRDPKVIWHHPTSRWVMALYLDRDEYALFSSPDLRDWTRLCDLKLPGCSECPDFFPLAVDGDHHETRWVFWGANGTYALGSFDGRSFVQEGKAQRYDWGGDSYAGQTWSDIPPQDGRRIQIAWLRGDLPGMPFNQQMTFPCELTLRTTRDGVSLYSQPVKEIERIQGKKHVYGPQTITPGENPLSQVKGELFHIRAELEILDSSELGLNIRGVPVMYNVEREQLSCLGRFAPLTPLDGVVRLQLLVDRASIEIFANDGEIALPTAVILVNNDDSLSFWTAGGSVRMNHLEVCELRSAWQSW